MPRIQIKTLDERVATAGLHMGGDFRRRKLQPFEVVDIPEDEALPDGTNLLDGLWNTGKIELTMDQPTRPLDYETPREAKLCSPTFKPRGPDEEVEQQRALEAVAIRLEQQAETAEPVVEAPAKQATPRRRSGKRALEQADRTHGEANTS